MAYGSEIPRRKIDYLKMVTLDENKKLDPHFQIFQKNHKGEIVYLRREQEIQGNLLKIGHGSYEWEKETIATITIVLVDGDQEMKLDLNIDTNLARGIMNKIINTPQPGWVVLRLYVKNDYPNCWVESDGEAMGWKYEYNDVFKPMIEQYQGKGGKMFNDYTKVNELLYEDWIKHEAVIRDNAKRLHLDTKPETGQAEAQPVPNASAPKFEGPPETEGPPDDEDEVGPRDDGDDLPF